jgi:four helix bundle protein
LEVWVQSYSDLRVWQKSHELVLEVYRLSAGFPAHERYGLTSQVRRAAMSVPSNLAEGSKRAHGNDFARFVNIAEGSLAETEYLLRLSKDLGYLAKTEELEDRVGKIAAMLRALRLRIAA